MSFLTDGEKIVKYTAAGLGAIQSAVLTILTIIYFAYYDGIHVVHAGDSYVYLYVYGHLRIVFGGFFSDAFPVFVFIYLFLNIRWLFVSGLILCNRRAVDERTYLKLWSIMTSLVCVLDFIAIILAGIDYNDCVNKFRIDWNGSSYYYIDTTYICNRGILPILFVAAKGFILWIVNFVMAIVLFRYSRKWVPFPTLEQTPDTNVLMQNTTLPPQLLLQSPQQQPQAQLQSPQLHLQSPQLQLQPLQPQLQPLQMQFHSLQPYPRPSQEMQNKVYVIPNRNDNQRNAPSVQENEDTYVPPVDYLPRISSTREVSSHLRANVRQQSTFSERSGNSVSPNHSRLLTHSSSFSVNNRQHSESRSNHANPRWSSQHTPQQNGNYGVSRSPSSVRPSTPSGYHEATTRTSYADTPGMRKVAPNPPPKPRRYPN